MSLLRVGSSCTTWRVAIATIAKMFLYVTDVLCNINLLTVSLCLFVSCLEGPALVLHTHLHSAALNSAVGALVRLQNEIHADKVLHQFIKPILYLSCEQDLGDFFSPKLHPIWLCNQR